MRAKTVLLLACLALMSVGVAQADPVLWNTGFGDSGLLAYGGSDTHYDLVTFPAGYTVPATSPVALTSVTGGWPIGPWLGDTTTSRWIVPDLTDNHMAGLWGYQTTFFLTPTEASYAPYIAGRWSTDNPGHEIRLNGQVTTQTTMPGSAAYGVWTPFTISPSDNDEWEFLAGWNTLTFIVSNGVQATGNPTGVRVEFLYGVNGTAFPVPVPAAAGLGFLGLALVGAIRRKRA
jgi:hypothetical protein